MFPGTWVSTNRIFEQFVLVLMHHKLTQYENVFLCSSAFFKDHISGKVFSFIFDLGSFQKDMEPVSRPITTLGLNPISKQPSPKLVNWGVVIYYTTNVV